MAKAKVSPDDVLEDVVAPVVADEVVADEVVAPSVPEGEVQTTDALTYEQVIQYLIQDISDDQWVALRSQVANKLEEALHLIRVK